MRLFGNFKINGGVEMSSKHDLLTAVITVVLIVIGGFLIYTNHVTIASVGTGLLMILSYWFARGGAITAQQAQPDMATAVNMELNRIAQTPATGGTPNAGIVPGNGSN